MRRPLSYVALLLIGSCVAAGHAFGQTPKPEEVELHQVADTKLRSELTRLAASVAIMIHKDDIRDYNWQGNGGRDAVFRLVPVSHPGFTLGGKRICTKSELPASGNQATRPMPPLSPAFGSCTAFKISDDSVVTAAHCASACEDSYFVFGLHADPSGRLSFDAIPKRRVYRCSSIRFAELAADFGASPHWPTMQDWSVLGTVGDIDQSIPPLPLNQDSSAVKPGDSLVMLAHPGGRALRVARGATALEVGDLGFLTNVTSFKGGSGAPVFRLADLLSGRAVVAGVHMASDAIETEVKLASGETCQAIKDCNRAVAPSCKGSHANQASAIAKKLPSFLRP